MIVPPFWSLSVRYFPSMFPIFLSFKPKPSSLKAAIGKVEAPEPKQISLYTATTPAARAPIVQVESQKPKLSSLKAAVKKVEIQKPKHSSLGLASTAAAPAPPTYVVHQ